MSNDYLREIDLNPAPALGGPINNPLDPRAMHYFGFLSEGQEIALAQPGINPRVLISFHYANQPTAIPPQPQPPIDAVLDTSFGPPVIRYGDHHDRAHVLIWLDPTVVLPGPLLVRVRAWATK